MTVKQQHNSFTGALYPHCLGWREGVGKDVFIKSMTANTMGACLRKGSMLAVTHLLLLFSASLSIWSAVPDSYIFWASVSLFLGVYICSCWVGSTAAWLHGVEVFNCPINICCGPYLSCPIFYSSRICSTSVLVSLPCTNTIQFPFLFSLSLLFIPFFLQSFHWDFFF